MTEIKRYDVWTVSSLVRDFHGRVRYTVPFLDLVVIKAAFRQMVRVWPFSQLRYEEICERFDPANSDICMRCPLTKRTVSLEAWHILPMLEINLGKRLGQLPKKQIKELELSIWWEENQLSQIFESDSAAGWRLSEIDRLKYLSEPVNDMLWYDDEYDWWQHAKG